MAGREQSGGRQVCERATSQWRCRHLAEVCAPRAPFLMPHFSYAGRGRPAWRIVVYFTPDFSASSWSSIRSLSSACSDLGVLSYHCLRRNAADTDKALDGADTTGRLDDEYRATLPAGSSGMFAAIAPRRPVSHSIQ